MKTAKNKKSFFGIIALVTVFMVAIVVLALYSVHRSRSVMNELLRNQMIDVAKSSSAKLDGDALMRISSGEKNADYQKIFEELSIFRDNTNLEYIYVMRYIPKERRYIFVVDTDPNDPGQYGEKIEATEAMDAASIGVPAVDDKAYADRWGSFYSAYAPVYDSKGERAGIIGVDFRADWYESEVSGQTVLIILICVISVVVSFLILFMVLWIAKKEVAIRRREHDELEIAKAQATVSNHEKNAFLESMSREIRVPIDTILSMDEMILRESVETSVRENATDIRHAGNRLLSMVDEMLDMSKIESEGMELNPVRYDPFYLISDLTEMMEGRARSKNLRFLTGIDDTLPSMLFGDVGRIKHCLMILMTDSLKYTSQGEIHFTVKREKIKNNVAWIRFSVRDSGEGVPDEAMMRMRKVFENGGALDDTELDGITELGLHIVHRFLRQMDSGLEFDSKLGMGSTFSFVLTQQVIDMKPVGAYKKAKEVMSIEESENRHEKYTAPDARVLVVDDAVTQLKVVKRLLSDTKVQVDTTDSAARGLELLAENTYDVMIFDHMMPEIDGIELLRLVRESRGNPNCNKPCIVLTVNDVEGAREEYLKVGFDAYLSKPVKQERLEGVLLRYLPRNKVKINPYQRFVSRDGRKDG